MHEVQARQAGLYLHAEIPETIPEKLIGDPTRLGQVLINLVSNALKFTDKGGVTIKLSHKPEYNLAKASEMKSCSVRFEVIDKGVGISKESQQKLFKPFSQTHAAVQRKKGGTGLGLAICKQLTEMMDGEIGVTSQVGKGSTFWFSVVLSNPESSSSNDPSEPNSAVNYKRRNAKVIVIEDNLLNQQLTVNILVREGYMVDMAENGKIGLDLYKKNRYDIVLMDIQMPVMDGIQATRLIREYENVNKLKKIRNNCCYRSYQGR